MDKHTVKKIWFVSLAATFILIFLGVTYWFLIVVPVMNKAQCGLNIAYIGRNINNSISFNDLHEKESEYLIFENNRGFFKECLDFLQNLGRENLTCPVCKKTYVYSPISPSGEKIELQGGASFDWRFVMWCPEPCHKDQRSYLMSDLSVFSFRDSEVSWFYQKRAEGLTDREFEKENEYRRSKGMEQLNKEQVRRAAPAKN